jgi:hypothetical protein
MFNLRRMATAAFVAATALAAVAGPAAAAPAKPVLPRTVGTYTITDSSGRVLVRTTNDTDRAPVTLGTPAAASVAAINCDGWLEVHFTLTEAVYGQTLLRWVHRVRSCVDGTNVTSLAERKEYVVERSTIIKVGELMQNEVTAAPASVVSSYYQRSFQFCATDMFCTYTWQPGNKIYALSNGTFVWQPLPYS